MKDLNHINIIQLYDYYETNTKHFLFMELCDTNLLEFLLLHKKVSENLASKMIR